MIYHTFSFDNLPAHQLVPYLIDFVEQCAERHLPWHVCWLNNQGSPVVGLLPKKSWSVSPITQPHNLKSSALNVEVTVYNRPQDQASQAATQMVTTRHMGYEQWISELIEYATVHKKADNKAHNGGNYSAHSINKPHESCVYHNGLMGFIGYDIAAKALSPKSDIGLAEQPAAFLGHYDIYLTPTPQGWQLHTQPACPQQAINKVMTYLQAFEAQLSSRQQKQLASPLLALDPIWDVEGYRSAFEQTQHYLYQGDSYQINLTQKWQGQLPSALHAQNDDSAKNHSPTQATATSDTDTYFPSDSPIRLVNYLPQLHQQTQAPFAGYLCITQLTKQAKHSDIPAPSGGHPSAAFELLSCSPELFVWFDNDHQGQSQILTKPIKGTLPRGKTPEQDDTLKQQLAMSEKDKAENVMIVDLLRNDLGKYAQIGSVKVPKLFAIESFSNVHHMVSSITATIKPEHHPLTVLFDSLPAGSITGTPKKRAVEIISELEVAPRGAYCGTLGFMNFSGNGQWNVLIRSLQADHQGNVALWAGGGITVGSECQSEYQECHDKVGNLRHILNPQPSKSTP